MHDEFSIFKIIVLQMRGYMNAFYAIVRAIFTISPKTVFGYAFFSIDHSLRGSYKLLLWCQRILANLYKVDAISTSK